MWQAFGTCICPSGTSRSLGQPNCKGSLKPTVTQRTPWKWLWIHWCCLLIIINNLLVPVWSTVDYGIHKPMQRWVCCQGLYRWNSDPLCFTNARQHKQLVQVCVITIHRFSSDPLSCFLQTPAERLLQPMAETGALRQRAFALRHGQAVFSGCDGQHRDTQEAEVSADSLQYHFEH